MNSPLFYLVELIPTVTGFRERVLDNYGPYPNGQDAAHVAKDLSRMRRHKVQPRRGAVPETWRADAAERLAAVLAQTPSLRLYPLWDLDPIPDHFARIHPNEDMVGYFPDANYAGIDRLVYVTPGRYLMEFYPGLSARRLNKLIAAFEGESMLHFARTPDEVEHVYRVGPNSCLKDEKGDILLDDGSIYHKPRFFGGPDLAVAYLSRNGRITARVVVCPSRHQYGRIYGDADRLSEALKKKNYAYARYFENVRVEPQLLNPKAVYDGASPVYTLPYFDNIIGVLCQDGLFRSMTIAEAADPSGMRSSHLLSLFKGEDGGYRLGRFCPLMESYVDERDMMVADDIDGFDGPTAVSRIGYTARTFVCGKLGRRFAKIHDRVWHVEGYGQVWSNTAFRQHGFSCPVSGRNVDRDRVAVATATDGRRMIADYIPEYEKEIADTPLSPVVDPRLMTTLDPSTWVTIGSASPSPASGIWLIPPAVTNISVTPSVRHVEMTIDTMRDIQGSIAQFVAQTQARRAAQVLDPVDEDLVEAAAPVAPAKPRAPRNRVVIDANRLRAYRNHRVAFEAIEGRPYPQSASTKRNPRTGDVTITYDD